MRVFVAEFAKRRLRSKGTNLEVIYFRTQNFKTKVSCSHFCQSTKQDIE